MDCRVDSMKSVVLCIYEIGKAYNAATSLLLIGYNLS